MSINWNNVLSGASGLLGNIAGPAVGAGSLMSAYNRLGSIGERAQQGAQQIANLGLEQTQFQPFTVRSSTGGMFGYDPQTGSVNMNVSPTEQNIQNQLLSQAQQGFGATPTGLSQLQQAGLSASAFGQGALGQTPGSSLFNLGQSQLGMTPGNQAMAIGQQSLGQTPYGLGNIQQASQQAYGLGSDFMSQAGMDTASRERDVFNRIREAQRPEEERQALALEERLANQGRLGVRSNLFGGTPEQLAMSQAQTEAQNRAALMAMQQAQQEQAQQAGLGAQYSQLGSSLTSQGQALGAAQQAQSLQALQAGQGMNLAQQQAAQAALQGGQGLNLAQQQQALAAMQTGQGLFGGALNLQGAQQQLAQNALANAYMPQAQLLNAQAASQLFPQLQQRGQLSGAGLFGEASMGGLEALLGSGLGQANLMGTLGTGLLGGLATPTANYGGLPEVFGDIFNSGSQFIGGLFGDNS